MIRMHKHSFLSLLLVFVMKCYVKMHCSLPDDSYCCLLPSPMCLLHMLICTCLNSSPIACLPSSVLCWCLLCLFWWMQLCLFFVCSNCVMCGCSQLKVSTVAISTFQDCMFGPGYIKVQW